MPEHTFFIKNLAEFLDNLEAKGFSASKRPSWTTHSKTLSGAVVKHYSYLSSLTDDEPVQIRVSYELLSDGKILERLVRMLKKLNDRYRKTLDGWKTKKKMSKKVSDRRWADVQRFLHHYGELISCFKYQADDRLTEGNYSFNLQIASTAQEQRICLEFIKALVEAHNPSGILWKRRQPDKPIQQRNGWIRREAIYLRQRGWRPLEIAREIQKDLRNGTWNQRSRLQFNIANSTVCKIAGIKIPPLTHH